MHSEAPWTLLTLPTPLLRRWYFSESVRDLEFSSVEFVRCEHAFSLPAVDGSTTARLERFDLHVNVPVDRDAGVNVSVDRDAGVNVPVDRDAVVAALGCKLEHAHRVEHQTYSTRRLSIFLEFYYTHQTYMHLQL